MLQHAYPGEIDNSGQFVSSKAEKSGSLSDETTDQFTTLCQELGATILEEHDVI